MKSSKNINVFLIDGDASGRIKCTLSNWTGIIYKIPRTKLDTLDTREDLKQSGVYFLIGKNDDNQKNEVYIGQAGVRKNGEGVLFRIKEHARDDKKDYFTEAIILTTQNNSFGPTEISYLENKFTYLAKVSNRYVVKNNNEPNLGNVTEEKAAELDEIIDKTKLIIGTLGYKLFTAINNVVIEKKEDKEQQIFYFSRNNKTTGITIEGIGKLTEEGFVLLSGSMIDKNHNKYLSEKQKELRNNCKIKTFESYNILEEDLLFNSPSAAAIFISGSSVNGRTSWKTESGKTLNEVESEKLKL